MANFKKAAYETDVILKSVVTAKGDIIVASGNGTVTVLAIGTDGYILSVATDTPAWIDPATLPVASHASTHKNGGADEILLNELGEPTGIVAFNGQQASDFVIENLATDSVAVLGKVYYNTGDNSVYICTSI